MQIGWRRSLCALLAAACLGGCSKEQFSETVSKQVQQVTEQVKDKVNQTAEIVKEQASLAGSLELKLDQSLKTGRCYASLQPLAQGRPAVLVITSYQSPGDETFPSAMLHAEVSAATPQALVGQKVPARLYAQTVADGPVWHSPDGEPVQLAITAADEKTVSGQIVAGKAVNTDAARATDVTGKFVATLR